MAGTGRRISAGTYERDDGRSYEIGILVDLFSSGDKRIDHADVFVQFDPAGENETIVNVAPLNTQELRQIADAFQRAALLMENGYEAGK